MGLENKVWLVTGGRQVGKSTALRSAVVELRQAGLEVTGLLTARTGPHDLRVTEVHTGMTYALTAPFSSPAESPLGNFKMDGEALVRSARALSESFPTQVFILDELGPLEFKHRQGWMAAFELLACESYNIAIIVVRPELLGQAVAELPGPRFNLLHITPSNRDRAPAWLLDAALRACAGGELRSGGRA